MKKNKEKTHLKTYLQAKNCLPTVATLLCLCYLYFLCASSGSHPNSIFKSEILRFFYLFCAANKYSNATMFVNILIIKIL